jgi:hypothetical protein
MGCQITKPPLLLERVGVRRIKSTVYISLIPTFSLKGEGATLTLALSSRRGSPLLFQLVVSITPNSCADPYALDERESVPAWR